MQRKPLKQEFAAIEGGYTGICPMANTNPAVDNVTTLSYTINKAKEVCEIGFYPICAVTKGLNGEKLVNVSELIEKASHSMVGVAITEKICLNFVFHLIFLFFYLENTIIEKRRQ